MSLANCPASLAATLAAHVNPEDADRDPYVTLTRFSEILETDPTTARRIADLGFVSVRLLPAKSKPRYRLIDILKVREASVRPATAGPAAECHQGEPGVGA